MIYGVYLYLYFNGESGDLESHDLRCLFVFILLYFNGERGI